MIRLVAAIFGLILGWFGFLSTAEAAIAAPTQSCVQAYEYDGHRMPVQVVDANSERGPPAAYDYATSHDAVGHQSRGDSVRPGGTTPRAAFAYDPQVSLAQAVSAATPTAGPGRVASGDLRAVSGAGVAAKSADEFVDLASASRRRHILDGEVRPNGSFGGGHRPGTGFPNKSEFPAGWSDDKIMHSISDVATDPSLTWRAGNKPGDFFVNGTRDGIDIEVLIRNNQIWTGYPTNVIRNAP